MRKQTTIILKENSKNQQRQLLQSLKQISLTDYQQKIVLSHRKWQNLNEILDSIKSWDASKIDLQANQLSNLHQRLCSIKFMNLRWLSLKFNRIQNIQALIQLNVPFLQYLNLQSNQFCKISCLRKTNFPNMKQIGFAGNKIIDFPSLTQCQWPKLQIIYLEYFLGVSATSDISFLAKIMSTNMRNIWLQHPQRIIKIKVLSAIKQKYPKMRMQTFKTIKLL